MPECRFTAGMLLQSMQTPTQPRGRSNPQPTDQNIRVIAELEQRALHDRTAADRLSDAVARVTGNGVFAAVNLSLFVAWMLVNTGTVPGITTIDPFPFSFLTLVVSLEAIFLAIFVLMSQNRMTRAADKRAHLNLQVDLLDLLAEQELTAMLQMLQALCTKFHVDVKVTDERIRQLINETDVHNLASALEDRLPEK
jgi:uncharacterized membrane protein